MGNIKFKFGMAGGEAGAPPIELIDAKRAMQGIRLAAQSESFVEEALIVVRKLYVEQRAWVLVAGMSMELLRAAEDGEGENLLDLLPVAEKGQGEEVVEKVVQ